MHCTNEFVSRHLSFAIFEGLSYISDTNLFLVCGFCAVSFMHINGCVFRVCVCVRERLSRNCGCTLTLQTIYIPLKNRLTHSLYNKDYETLDFSRSFSVIFCISWLMQTNNNKINTERYRRHIFFWQLLFFWRCCCGYRHMMLAQKVVVRSSCQIRNDRTILTKATTTATPQHITIDSPFK